MTDYYIHPDGTIPLQGGDAVLATEAAWKECCCLCYRDYTATCGGFGGGTWTAGNSGCMLKSSAPMGIEAGDTEVISGLISEDVCGAATPEGKVWIASGGVVRRWRKPSQSDTAPPAHVEIACPIVFIETETDECGSGEPPDFGPAVITRRCRSIGTWTDLDEAVYPQLYPDPYGEICYEGGEGEDAVEYEVFYTYDSGYPGLCDDDGWVREGAWTPTCP